VCVSQTSRRGIFTRQGGHAVWYWAGELSSCVQYRAKAVIVKLMKAYYLPFLLYASEAVSLSGSNVQIISSVELCVKRFE